MRISAVFFLLLAFGGSGCSGAGDDAPPSLEPGGCELAPFAWLPASDVGAVLSREEDLLSPLQASAVDALLPEDAQLFTPVPFGGRVFRIRYTTQDRGRPVEATGLVGIPFDPDGLVGDFPLVLWLHGTVGFMGACAPSLPGNAYVMGVYLLASLGYVVAAPDYIGLDAGAEVGEPPPVYHAYLNIEQTALGSLDAVRAARQLLATDPELRVTLRDDLVLWGGSQGGHAALAAELLAPYYAPEEDVLATVAMVPPTDLLGLADYGVSSVNPASAAVAAVLVAGHYWYEGAEPFEELLSTVSPWNAASALPTAMYSTCDLGDVFDGATAMEHVYNAELLAAARADGWESLEPWACYLRESSFATTSIPRLSDSPTLVVLGENDTLIYTPVIQADFDRLCDLGYRLDYLECAEADHVEGAGWSLPDQVNWVNDRLAGEPLDESRLCQRQAPVRCLGQPE